MEIIYPRLMIPWMLILLGGTLFVGSIVSCGGEGVSIMCLSERCMLPVWKYGGILVCIVGIILLII